MLVVGAGIMDQTGVCGKSGAAPLPKTVVSLDGEIRQPTLVSQLEPLVSLALAPLAMHSLQSLSSLRLGKKKKRGDTGKTLYFQSHIFSLLV